MTIGVAEITITAQNQFSEWVSVTGGFNVSVADPQGGTITLQRRFGTDDAARDAKEYTAAAEEHDIEYESEVQYRIGCKTGDYGSGTVLVRVSC